MKLHTTTTPACASRLPLGEGPGIRELRVAQLTRDLEQTIARNVAEILEK